jgi:hypothetical protein
VCTFKADNEAMVCDVAIGKVRSRVEAELDGVEFTTVPGEGTLVHASSAADQSHFRALVQASIDDANHLG